MVPAIFTVPCAWSKRIPRIASNKPPSIVMFPVPAAASMTPIASRKISSISDDVLAALSFSSNSGFTEKAEVKKCLTASLEKFASIPDAIPVTIDDVIDPWIYS